MHCLVFLHLMALEERIGLVEFLLLLVITVT
jgi:hypothetical protein